MSHNTQLTSSTNGLTGVLAGNPSSTNLPVGEQVFSMCAQYIGAEYAVIAARRELANDQSLAKNDSVKAGLTSGLAAATSTVKMYDNDAEMTRQDAKTQISSAVMSGVQGLVGGGGLVGAVRANSVSSKMDGMSDELNKVNVNNTQVVVSDEATPGAPSVDTRTPDQKAKDSIIAKYTKRLTETSGGEAAGIRSGHYEKIVGKDANGKSGVDFNLAELEDATEHGLAAGDTLPKVTLKDVFEAAPAELDRVALRAGIGRGQRNAMKEANHKNTNVQTAMQIANGVSGAASNSANAQFKMDSANEAEQKGASARDQALSQAAMQVAQDTSRTQSDTISGANQDVQTAIRSIVEMGQPIHV